MRKLFFSVISILILTSCASRMTKMEGQNKFTLETEIVKKVKMNYLLYLPPGYNESGQEWPLMMFLHGSGERGDDIEKVKVHGPPKLIAAGKDFPFIVVSPQCPEEERWQSDELDALIQNIIDNYNVDEKRIYLTGLSMGGFGTWDLASAYPERFAAIAPVCGGGNPRNANKLKNIPAWVFHGEKDPVVPVEEAHKMVDALKKSGAEVKLTIYPEAGHDSWTETYDNPDLYDWFLSKVKK